MKKNMYLGIGKNNQCCILESILDLEMLKKHKLELESNDFIHSATNWEGHDDIPRTLELKNLELTGNELRLPKPIEFSGVDHDHGHEYEWKFTVYEIKEIRR